MTRLYISTPVPEEYYTRSVYEKSTTPIHFYKILSFKFGIQIENTVFNLHSYKSRNKSPMDNF